MLAAVEGTRAERWVDLTFGMTDGWWKFTDTDLRPGYPLLPKSRWLELLNDAGFSESAAVEPATGASQVLLLGRAPKHFCAGRWLL